MDEPLITVSVPMWRAQDTIRRAVDGLLAQTFRAIKIVVVNDGGGPEAWEPLADIDDERLVQVDLTENLGRYHADHFVLHQHCETPWLAIHDADDWAEPEWLEELVGLSRDRDAVLADHWVHPMHKGPTQISRAVEWDGSKRWLWHGHMAGLYRADFLREHEILNPHVRVAWDAFLTGAVQVVGAAVVSHRPLYHRVRRRDSLSTSRETGVNSPFRKELTPQIRKAWEQVVDHPERCGEIVDSFRPRRSATDLLITPRLFTSGWPLSQGPASELDALLWSRRPRMVLEAGSGHSTLVCARYAKATGARVVSLEHSQKHHRQTQMLLKANDLAAHVDLRLAPLDDGAQPWYITELPDGIDFALVDGPPGPTGGRARAFDALAPHLAPHWAILLDDADRPEESAMADVWRAQAGASLRRRHDTALLTSDPMNPEIDASDVVLTVLTGQRPQLLKRTIGSLPDSLLSTARLLVLHTGAADDEESTSYLNELPFEQWHTPDVQPLGENTSALAELARQSGQPLWLHLEDDWAYDTHHHDWLDDARQALTDPSVAQVRLRHFGEKVLARSRATNRQIRWEANGPVLIAPEAHLTFNPFLMRAEDIGKVFPASGERDAQRRAHRMKLRRIAQHTPGVWRHIGDEDSLRARTGCEQ